MHILVGLDEPNPARESDILSEFGKHFEGLYPQHAVFNEARQNNITLSRAVPLLIHGDEGRGRKHVAHFVCSFHAITGFGFSKAAKRDVWAKLEVNFARDTLTNRFLIATLRKKDYTDQQSPTWALLMDAVATEAGYMWKTGVEDANGVRYWGIVISIVGDWPWLHKCGSFTRSFNNIQKKITVRNPPGGICHLCQAGQLSWPFEQVATKRPGWLSTMFVEDPFQTPSPFVANLLHEPGKEAALWAFDWFHTMHLGVLKQYLGSVIALLSDEEPHGSIDDRFASLTDHYRAWCESNSKRAHVLRLSKELISWEKRSTYPTGTWHKGALTTILMEYVESRFSSTSFPHEPLLGLAAEACEAIQRLHRILYRATLFLKPDDCKFCADLGLKFLRRYSQMATLAQQSGKCLFVYQPKIHVLHHMVIELHSAYENRVWGLNPLSKSCQPSEDFIGKPSRLCRRVTARSNPVLHRIMDRYLQSAYSRFVTAGFLVRSRE
eukprot:Skav202718  [mRNA]  locus=scaffold654:828822:830303:- [translate_table: standard]